MNDLKLSSKEILNTNEIEKDTNKIVSNFSNVQKRIESNTKALQELQKALTDYQETLNKSDGNEIPGLEQIKKAILVMDTLESITSKFKNVGRGKTFPLIYCYCFESADINMCSLGY